MFVTQVMDPTDPVLGFTVGWIRALASRCDRLTVIANEVRRVPDDLEARVVSLGKEQGAPPWRRFAAYLAHLQRTLVNDRPDALFAHMCPRYLNAAAPLLSLHGVAGVLWFAHPRDSRALRIAERASALVLTSLPGAFPFSSRKVRIIGQGIDMAAFCGIYPPVPHDGLDLLALGRLSPVKGLHTIIAAASKLRADDLPVRLRIVGPATTSQEEAYAQRLRRLAAETDGWVSIESPVPAPEVPRVLAEADVLVNGTRAGSGDKVVLEAMAAGRLAVWSNPCFDGLAEGLPMRLRYREGDATDLAEVLRGIWKAPVAVRAQTAEELRARVREGHSLDGWADRVVDVIGKLAVE
ncbi:MAG: glycosyltransferase family 4 protein [Armatimonadota bacterium]|nr:glycosyltransferase family 4 protein [Armatimonadota bacterium]